MDNYNEIMDKEQVMNRKESLVDETITKGKLTQYEIISRMFDGLLKEIEELKKYYSKIYLLQKSLKKRLKKFQR